MFINQQYQFGLNGDMFEFLWVVCDSARMASKPYPEHRDYMKTHMSY